MNELRFGLRMLARNPGSSASIVALLAIGIAASTTIFSLFYAVLLRPLPVRHPEQLVRIVQRFPEPVGVRSKFPYSYYKALSERTNALEAVFGETEWHEHFRITQPGPAKEITVYGVTPEFFTALECPPFMGRFLTTADATFNSDTPPAVLSYTFWRSHFGANQESIEGQTLSINRHKVSIVGVMPRSFHGLSADTGPDVRILLPAYRLLTPSFNMDHTELALAGRLKPSLTLVQAQQECLTIWLPIMQNYYQNIARVPPNLIPRLLQRGIEVQSLEHGTSVLRDSFGDAFKLLMASVIVVELIVALNVAGLLLARAAVRRREIAVRVALGGTPIHIARQLLAESFFLSAFGAFWGAIVALMVIPLAVRSLPPVRDLYTAVVPISIDVGLNWRVFSFLLASSLITTFIFSSSPIVAAVRSSIDPVLRTVRSSDNFRGRQVLITAQIALCTFLLASAGLLVRSFNHLRATPSGFATDSIATFWCDIGTSDYSPDLANRLIEGVRELPGVVAVAASASGVLRGHGLFTTAVPAGQRITRADYLNANANQVSRDYFTTMGMRLVAGRDFGPTDASQRKQTTDVKVIVNESFVKRVFPGSNGLGKRFGSGAEGSIASAANEIVGVVSDAKYRSLRDPIQPMVYTLLANFDSDFMLNVRTLMAPETIIQPVRKVFSSDAPGAVLLEATTLARTVDETTAPERIIATLVSLFGAMSALLAGIGVYGLLAYSVTRRRREISVYMALGAQPEQVAKLVAGQTLAMTVTGIFIGLGAIFLAVPVAKSLVYGISPLDPVALVGSAIIVTIISTAATIGPMLKAIQTSASESLRTET